MGMGCAKWIGSGILGLSRDRAGSWKTCNWGELVTTTAIWLFAALLFGHFLGDYTHLATDRMQAAKATGSPPITIFAHAAVHAALVLAAVWLITAASWSLILAATGIELGTHFAIDTFRARMGARLPALRDPSRRIHWYAFGADQLLHALVLLWIVVLVSP